LIVHRLGEVPVGQVSVVVGCSSAHRVATFQALPWIMDELKRDVPIWKRELYTDGTTEWVHPTDE
jgi:molybdopterin synthase catalytic subunit